MSTEQKKDHQTSEAAERLSHGWDQFKQGKIISYRWMAIILLIITGIGVFLYIRAEGTKADSKKWTELEEATTVEKLREYIKAHPNTVPGKVAELMLARLLLGPEGIDAMATRDEGRRRKAVENIEEAKGLFERVAEDLKDDRGIVAQCYYGRAKAEEALIGITKEGKIDEYRGNVDTLIDWLNKLATAAPETKWGENAKEFADLLKNPAKRKELQDTQIALYRIDPLVPTSPFTPGGAPPFGPVPGVPGGGVPPVGPVAPTGPAPGPGTAGPPAPPPMTGTTSPGPTPPGPTPPAPPPTGTTPPPTGTTPPTTPPAPPPGTTPPKTPPAPPPGPTPPAPPPKNPEPPKPAEPPKK